MFRSRTATPLADLAADSDRWRLPGWFVVACGLAAAFSAGLVLQARTGVLPMAQESAGAVEQPAPLVVPTVANQSYRGQVLRVIDGDTVEARLQTWPGQEVVTLVRLRGIDTPELAGACVQERVRAEEARDALAALIGNRGITVSDVGPDKYYGRVVARLVTSDGTDAGQALLDRGLARVHARGQRGGWCQAGLTGARG
jgi:micrococcal nuclease